MRGIATGADTGAAWLLPWWYENVRAYNPTVPVAFANFGMSARQVLWCASRGRVLLGMPNHLYVTARKPFAIAASPFDVTLWLDLDCEVRGDLTLLFDACDTSFAAAPDGHHGLDPKGDPVNAGVLVVRRDSPVLSAWVAAIEAQGGEAGPDQPTLNRLPAEVRAGIARLPRRYNWLRAFGRAPAGALVVHWTGRKGKGAIRSSIRRRASGRRTQT